MTSTKDVDTWLARCGGFSPDYHWESSLQPQLLWGFLADYPALNIFTHPHEMLHVPHFVRAPIYEQVASSASTSKYGFIITNFRGKVNPTSFSEHMSSRFLCYLPNLQGNYFVN
jgi:hypothetical protein